MKYKFFAIAILALFFAFIALLFFYYPIFFGETKKLKTESGAEQKPAKQFEPALLSWSLATSSAAWETRDSAASFVFKGKMWTMGGLDGNTKVQGDNKVRYWEAPHFNDIWSTTDGVNWKLEKSNAEWAPRRSMTVVEFNGKLFMFGGWSSITGYASDIWQSEDGISWIKVVSQAPWPAREGHSAEVFDGKIWLFGGVNYDKRETKNDVWYSSDGVNWEQATPKRDNLATGQATTIPWSTRWDQATAVFKGKIFLAGGMDLKGNTFNDEWVSSDGLNWELVTANAPWPSRQGHSLVVYKDRLWIIGRLNDKETGGPNDVWYSDDGVDWRKTDADPPWIGREDHSVLVFRDRIWVFGGTGADWRWHNDVWFSNPQGDKKISVSVSKNGVGEPELSANSFVSVFVDDNGDERVLFKKNKETQLPIASITKLMTALVASEKYGGNDLIVVSKNSLNVKGASGIYREGERILFADALKAMLIGSHNEIASAFGESSPDFVELMNKKVSEVGLSKTIFFNSVGTDPNGADSINRSTPYDVYKLARYVRETKPEILKITAQKEFRLSDADGNFLALVTSTDKLLGDEKLPFTILGGKTGETPKAKQNLVLVTDAPCGKLFSVVLGSDDNFGDMRKILRYVNEAYEIKC